jgi:prefoldin subunit 5|tara:strand:- start:967 stop:1146 length:180 start_codon:yes stop_codon:yes gene_type:complete
MQGDSKKQSRKRDPEDLVRQVAHLKSRMGNLQKDIRRLEYDNALLQRKLQTLTSIKKGR